MAATSLMLSFRFSRVRGWTWFSGWTWYTLAFRVYQVPQEEIKGAVIFSSARLFLSIFFLRVFRCGEAEWMERRWGWLSHIWCGISSAFQCRHVWISTINITRVIADLKAMIFICSTLFGNLLSFPLLNLRVENSPAPKIRPILGPWFNECIHFCESPCTSCISSLIDRDGTKPVTLPCFRLKCSN